MKKEENPVGHIKFWFERVKNYGAYLSSLMVVDLWVRAHDYSWLIVAPVLAVAILAIYWLDKHYVYGGEAAASFQNNPEWTGLRSDVAELLKHKNGKQETVTTEKS